MAFRVKSKAYGDEVSIIGVTPHPLRDSYQWLVKAPWYAVLGVVTAIFLLGNALYALAYLKLGGVMHARPDSFEDAFFFSVQTMATIGYGDMYPASRAANTLVTSEAIVGLLITALATGLVFQRFSQPRSSIIFTSRLVITQVDGVPTLMARIGNDRHDAVINAEIRLDLIKTTTTLEGATLYRSTEVKLVRNRAMSLSRAWNVMHVIDADSPLNGLTPEGAVTQEIEAALSVFGFDEVTHQVVSGRRRYETRDILFGAKPVDILRDLGNGQFEIDVRKFDLIEPTPATERFPFTWKPE